jgi:Fic-DOC domain mobile mystery protein B
MIKIDHLTGSTPIDPDQLDGLIPNIATQQELNEFEATNILSADEWALNSRRLKNSDPFSEEYVRKLHEKMFDQTWEWAGEYRKKETLPVGVDPNRIVEELGALLGNARYWNENKTFDVDETAVRFHHRMVWIHPFANGNGRHARLLADVVAVKLGRERFSWGAKTFTQIEPLRNELIRCLRVADANNDDIKPLVKFARS